MYHTNASKQLVDYYSVLNVPRDASDTDIKKAFRKIAIDCHPDKTGSGCTGQFILAREAFDTLTDKKIKSAYDQRLSVKTSGAATASHDLSFVSEYLRKTKQPVSRSAHSPQLKVTIARNQCLSCQGYGARRDRFNMVRACKLCGGNGRRRSYRL